MCERIGVGRVTTDSAKQLFQKVSMENMLRGKSQEAVIASCIYIACREQNVTRTFKEIYALTKVSKKDIGKYVQKMMLILTLLFVHDLFTIQVFQGTSDSFVESFAECKPGFVRFKILLIVGC